MNIEVIESMGHWLQVLRRNDELLIKSFDESKDLEVALDRMSASTANWLYDGWIKDNEDLLLVEVLKYGRKPDEMATLTELGFNFEEISS